MGDFKKHKMVLKISFHGKSNIKIRFFNINKNYLSIKENKFHKSEKSNANFIIYEALFFDISPYTKILSIPSNNIKRTIDISFNNDNERKIFLDDLKNSLIEWSNSNFWKNQNNTKGYIKYVRSMWLIY